MTDVEALDAPARRGRPHHARRVWQLRARGHGMRARRGVRRARPSTSRRTPRPSRGSSSVIRWRPRCRESSRSPSAAARRTARRRPSMTSASSPRSRTASRASASSPRAGSRRRRRTPSSSTSSCAPARSDASARPSSASSIASATARTASARASSTCGRSSASRASATSTPRSAPRSTPRPPRELALPPPANRAPSGPVTLENAPAQATARTSRGARRPIVDQKQEGYVAAYMRLRLGDITSEEMRALGRIADELGDGTVRLTIDQNILLPVGRQALGRRALRAAVRRRASRVATSTPCATSRAARAPTPATSRSPRRAPSRAPSPRASRPTGSAPRATPRARSSRSAAARTRAGSTTSPTSASTAARRTPATAPCPVYQLHLGGGVDERGARFGRQVVKIIARRVPEAVVRLLRFYEAERTHGETPGHVLRARRRQAGRRRARRRRHRDGRPATSARTSERAPGFLIHSGEGECAA